MEAKNFTRTRLVSETQLAKFRYGNQHKGLEGEDVHEVAVMGALTNKKRPDRPPDLLYAVTTRRPKAQTRNILQWSGAILGMSKNLLFGKVLAFLRYFRPECLEILYCGEEKKSSFPTPPPPPPPSQANNSLSYSV